LIGGRWEEDCPASPHKLLNAYVHRLANFTPLDADAILLEQEEDIGPPNIGGFPWGRIERGANSSFRAETSS
jgi:hypothetical protein